MCIISTIQYITIIGDLSITETVKFKKEKLETPFKYKEIF